MTCNYVDTWSLACILRRNVLLHHHCWKGSPFFTCESSSWIANETMMILWTETLSRIKLSVFKLLKWRALKVGSLCLSLVIDFLSAISEVLSLPLSLILYVSLLFPFSLSTYPPSACARHPAGLSSLIRHMDSMKNKGMLMFSVRSLLYCAHACLRTYSSFYLLASLLGCLPPLLVCQSACRWPCTSRV